MQNKNPPSQPQANMRPPLWKHFILPDAGLPNLWKGKTVSGLWFQATLEEDLFSNKLACHLAPLSPCCGSKLFWRPLTAALVVYGETSTPLLCSSCERDLIKDCNFPSHSFMYAIEGFNSTEESIFPWFNNWLPQLDALYYTLEMLSFLSEFAATFSMVECEAVSPYIDKTIIQETFKQLYLTHIVQECDHAA